MLSARPRAVALSGGALIVAGGRPGLNFWISVDGGDYAEEVSWTITCDDADSTTMSSYPPGEYPDVYLPDGGVPPATALGTIRALRMHIRPLGCSPLNVAPTQQRVL